MEQSEISQRYKTLDLSDIDAEYLARRILDNWNYANRERQEFLDRREDWLLSWRDLRPNPKESRWENSANFHVPMQLTYGKAIHARLWQMFSDQRGLFGVAARREAYKDKENSVKEFMDFILTSWMNNKTGSRDVFDDMLWDMVFDGSGYLKLGWYRRNHQFLDVEPVLKMTEQMVFDRENLTGRLDTKQEIQEEEVLRDELVETPMVSALPTEDVLLPVGQSDPQTADFVINRVYLTDDEMKQYALDEVFDRDVVEEVLPFRTSTGQQATDGIGSIKQTGREADGYDAIGMNGNVERHAIIEWYGTAFVKREFEQDMHDDVNLMQQEIVAYVHEETGKLLGWTYLYRVSPSGIRPIFKFDFIRFPRRSQAVGVPESLDDISRNVDAMYNLRVDNGTISSMPMGVYRSTSGLKSDTIRMSPGTLFPVDDVQDIRMLQFPYLAGFGEREESNLMGMAERLLTVSDIQLGISPQKVGALRNATGSNLLASESGIQFEIHYDRLARTMNKFLQATFRLCRQRMPDKLFYRVTGDRGESVFGSVDKRALQGEWDFLINVDVLGQSRAEQQQQATLLMQTLLNPSFINTGIVQPKNIYAIAKNYLKKNKFGRVDEFITPPQDYTGEMLNTDERIYRITVGRLDGLLDTVQLQEDHQKAIDAIERFKKSDNYGLLETPVQLRALDELQGKHQQLLQASGTGFVNTTGTQMPREGLGPIDTPMGGGGETLQAQQTAQGLGTPNGPMV